MFKRLETTMRYRGQFVYITSPRGLLLFKVFVCGGKGVVDGFEWLRGMLQESEWSLLGSQIGAFHLWLLHSVVLHVNLSPVSLSLPCVHSKVLRHQHLKLPNATLR